MEKFFDEKDTFIYKIILDLEYYLICNQNGFHRGGDAIRESIW